MTRSTSAGAGLRAITEDRLSLGIVLMLAAFFCFASMDTSAKWLVEATVPALEVAFVRYLIHFLWVLAIYLPRDGRRIFQSRQPARQTLRAALLLGSTALNFTALAYLPLSVTISIFSAAPIVVCLLSVPILGERVGIRRLLAVLAGFIGVLIIIRPGQGAFDWHILLALAALLSASTYFVMNRLLAGIDGNAVTQCYAAGIASLCLAPFALMNWVWPATAVDWAVMLLLGSLGMLGHTLLVHAHRYAEASTLAPMVYSQLVYIAFYSWLLFDAPPDRYVITGSLVIVTSGMYIWLRERYLKSHTSAITG